MRYKIHNSYFVGLFSGQSKILKYHRSMERRVLFRGARITRSIGRVENLDSIFVGFIRPPTEAKQKDKELFSPSSGVSTLPVGPTTEAGIQPVSPRRRQPREGKERGGAGPSSSWPPINTSPNPGRVVVLAISFPSPRASSSARTHAPNHHSATHLPQIPHHVVQHTLPPNPLLCQGENQPPSESQTEIDQRRRPRRARAQAEWIAPPCPPRRYAHAPRLRSIRPRTGSLGVLCWGFGGTGH